jgi:hypothetical protein
MTFADTALGQALLDGDNPTAALIERGQELTMLLGLFGFGTGFGINLVSARVNGLCRPVNVALNGGANPCLGAYQSLGRLSTEAWLVGAVLVAISLALFIWGDRK